VRIAGLSHAAPGVHVRVVEIAKTKANSVKILQVMQGLYNKLQASEQWQAKPHSL